MLHLIDGFGLRDGRGAFAQVEDLIVASVVLFLVRLIDENKRLQCLHLVYLISSTIPKQNPMRGVGIRRSSYQEPV
jgi:hypothetical protein